MIDKQTMERVASLTAHLYEGGEVTSSYIEGRYEVSRATAKRTMLLLEIVLPQVSVSFREVKSAAPNRNKARVLRLVGRLKAAA